VLRKIPGSDQNEIKKVWRRSRDAKLYDLYCSPDITVVIKLLRMRLAEHAACLGERKGAYRVLGSKPQGENLKNLVVDRRIILKLSFKKEDWVVDVIDVAQDGKMWQTFLNTVLKFWVL
jgi:hypothetical protein